MSDRGDEMIPEKHRKLFERYIELAKRRMETYAWSHGYNGLEVTETELRGMIEEVTEALRIDCKLDDDMHIYLKGTLLTVIFGPTKKQWSVKKGNSNAN